MSDFSKAVSAPMIPGFPSFFGKTSDVAHASALVFGAGDRPGIACSDINVLHNPVPCKGCNCWFGKTVKEVLEVARKARGGAQ